jgi:hypothetical protein
MLINPKMSTDLYGVNITYRKIKYFFIIVTRLLHCFQQVCTETDALDFYAYKDKCNDAVPSLGRFGKL